MADMRVPPRGTRGVSIVRPERSRDNAVEVRIGQFEIRNWFSKASVGLARKRVTPPPGLLERPQLDPKLRQVIHDIRPYCPCCDDVRVAVSQVASRAWR